jgi:ribosome-associated translation inhibitor RaiA
VDDLLETLAEELNELARIVAREQGANPRRAAEGQRMSDDLIEFITLHGVLRSPALERDIRSRVEKLRQFYPAITSCRVVIERPHKRHHRGGQFVLRLRLAVPRADFAVNHDHSEDVHVAIRDAFDAARRKLEDHVRARGGRAKSHRAARTAAGRWSGG